MHWLGIDIGGTKVAAGLVDDFGVVSTRRSAPTDPADPWSTVRSVVDPLLAVIDAGRLDDGETVDGIAGCGVGCGGPMSRGGESVSPLHIPAWREFPLRRRVAELTGVTTVVDNDAKALAVGEGWSGAAVGALDYLGMVVSTGVGAGLVLGGRLVHGRSGNAGHVGHVVVEPDGRPCRCGGFGCLEAEASGTAIEASLGAPPATAGPDVVARTGRLVGRALASVFATLDIDLAVIGGSVALGFGDPFFTAVRHELGLRARLDFLRDARVVPARPESGIVGAAGLAATERTACRPG